MPEIFYSTGAHEDASPHELLFFCPEKGRKRGMGIMGIMGIMGVGGYPANGRKGMEPMELAHTG